PRVTEDAAQPHQAAARETPAHPRVAHVRRGRRGASEGRPRAAGPVRAAAEPGGVMSEHQHHDEHEHHGHGAGLETSAARATQPGVAHDDHAGHDHAGHDHAGHDHGAHDHSAHDHGAHDHGGHAGHDPAQFRKLFWISLLLTVPTLVFSTGLQGILGLGGPRFPGSEWIPAVFGAAITVIGGRIFLTGAWHELRGKSPGMMTLISLAIVVSFGYSTAVMFGLPGMDFWWELSTLITI